MAGEVEKKGAAEVATISDDILKEMEAATATAKAQIDMNEDVRLPNIRLVQATMDVDGAKPGQLHDTLTMESADTMDVIPLQMFKTRALFTGNIGDAPVCTSPDAITGFGDPGGDCSRCPHSDWRNGGRCQLRYNYLVMPVGEGHDPTVEMPRGVMMHGTSAKVASRLNTMLLASRFLWSNVVKIGSVSSKNDKGTFRVWDVKREREATQEEQLTAFQWHKQIAAARNVQIEGDNAAAPAAPKGDDDIPF